MTTIPILKMEGITKNFLKVRANERIDFELYPNEICALLGENGAGKTTLMNILFGLYHPDEGRIYLNGKEVKINSPKEALQLGVGMVHQHFNLVHRHRVWENIILGMQQGILLNKSEACKRISNISKKFGLKIDLESFIWQLSVGERQRVEIVKALFRGAQILVLDEPTAVLTPQEAQSLFATLKDMVKKGLSIIIISHKLKEVMDISDRVVVLRQGKVLKSVKTKQTSVEELTDFMMGEESLREIRKKESREGKEILRVEKLRAKNDMGLEALKGISFNLKEGEVLGLAGVSGNGQKELAEVLSGTRNATSGKVYFDHKPIRFFSPPLLIRLKWGRIPEDRMGDGIIHNLSVLDNCLLEVHSRPEFHKGFLLNLRKARDYARELVTKYDIRPPITDTPVHNLSGGNIQKLILARELSLQPRMLIASQPTWGLDVKAINFIQELLLEERQAGTAILLISEDLDEIMNLSDRVAVMYEGEILGILHRDEASRSRIGRLMAGYRESLIIKDDEANKSKDLRNAH